MWAEGGKKEKGVGGKWIQFDVVVLESYAELDIEIEQLHGGEGGKIKQNK